MSVDKKGSTYFLRIRPFGPELITVRTPVGTKGEAQRIERAILTACAAGDYRGLDPEARATCVTMFRNRQWEMPTDLSAEETIPKQELTLWRAAEIFLNYPSVKVSKTRWRYVYALQHLVRKWGKDRPVRDYLGS